VSEARIKGKGKGKEMLLRFDGEVVEGESEPVLGDPRKAQGFEKPKNLRPWRPTLYEVHYEVSFYQLHSIPADMMLNLSTTIIRPDRLLQLVSSSPTSHR
jgi:hypothetical protein